MPTKRARFVAREIQTNKNCSLKIKSLGRGRFCTNLDGNRSCKPLSSGKARMKYAGKRSQKTHCKAMKSNCKRMRGPPNGGKSA